MRLVVDLQGAQGRNGQRGIGRYTLALTTALLRRTGDHEVWIALSGAFPDTIEPLRAAFDALLPQQRIVVWEPVTPAGDLDPADALRRQASEILRESFLASLRPNVVYVPSLFEGPADDTVTSIGRLGGGAEVAVTLHDLIPLAHPGIYLRDPAVNVHYQRKLASLRRAGLWLPVSEWSRREAIELLDLPAEKLVTVPGAADARFRPIAVADDEVEAIRRRLGLVRPYVMYTGGKDRRKNVDGLIGAYAALPPDLRRSHQLLIVHSGEEDSIAALRLLARRRGLAPDDLVIASSVSDDDLVILYNRCAAFCFASWHEGFGLPALEAMQCGAPTIGANASSLPEVIGCADALFDPHDEQDMAARLRQVLGDPDYRRRLVEHGLAQARRFGWAESARRAWAAFEAHAAEIREPAPARSAPPSQRPRLAYVSPLPPARSGIADYSAELLPELARHYEVEVVVDQPAVEEPWVEANCPVRDAAWFRENARLYDRILYHFGNNTLHRYMFDLADRHPGVVLPHDFYLSGIVEHMETREGHAGLWTRALYESHGYEAVRERYHTADPTEVIWKYPVNLGVVRGAVGVIVHSRYSRDQGRRFYGEALARGWHVVPHMRRLPPVPDRAAARAALGFEDDDFVVCSFGVMGPIKLNHRLLHAWLQSGLAGDARAHLVFVGEEHEGDYGAELRRMLRADPNRRSVRLTGYASPALYRQYLAAADVAVQLRTLSRGESSGTALDCLAHGVPLVANAHGAMAELPADCVVMLPDAFTDAELAEAMAGLRADPARRSALAERGRAHVREHLSPRLIAERYRDAIERSYRDGREALRARTLAALAKLGPADGDEREWLAVARALDRSVPPLRAMRQLLVDVSELVQRDAKTGIQRVVRGVLKELLANPPAEFRVEPVYAVPGEPGYRYARRFTLRLLDCPEDALEDARIALAQGDVFLGLDLQPELVPEQAAFLARARDIGVGTYFVVHDLLPVLLPHAFHGETSELHLRWLSTVARHAEGIVAVSRTVADQFAAWLGDAGIERPRPPRIGWFHIGADLESTNPTTGLPAGAADVLAALASRPSFLMVGTVEPRKAHAQALGAFERLWADGVEANLAIVGKQGWMVEALAKRLRRHAELGRRLFWLEGISDEYLEKVYAACTCLLAASEGEGFGLPLIEAARHRLPILARDIPVFREVAGEHAAYFGGSAPDDLARAVRDWLAAFAACRHPRSDDLPWLTWAESTRRLTAFLLGGGGT